MPNNIIRPLLDQTEYDDLKGKPSAAYKRLGDFVKWSRSGRPAKIGKPSPAEYMRAYRAKQKENKST